MKFCFECFPFAMTSQWEWRGANTVHMGGLPRLRHGRLLLAILVFSFLILTAHRWWWYVRRGHRGPRKAKDRGGTGGLPRRRGRSGGDATEKRTVHPPTSHSPREVSRRPLPQVPSVRPVKRTSHREWLRGDLTADPTAFFFIGGLPLRTSGIEAVLSNHRFLCELDLFAVHHEAGIPRRSSGLCHAVCNGSCPMQSQDDSPATACLRHGGTTLERILSRRCVGSAWFAGVSRESASARASGLQPSLDPSWLRLNSVSLLQWRGGGGAAIAKDRWQRGWYDQLLLPFHGDPVVIASPAATAEEQAAWAAWFRTACAKWTALLDASQANATVDRAASIAGDVVAVTESPDGDVDEYDQPVLDPSLDAARSEHSHGGHGLWLLQMPPLQNLSTHVDREHGAVNASDHATATTTTTSTVTFAAESAPATTASPALVAEVALDDYDDTGSRRRSELDIDDAEKRVDGAVRGAHGPTAPSSRVAHPTPVVPSSTLPASTRLPPIRPFPVPPTCRYYSIGYGIPASNIVDDVSPVKLFDVNPVVPSWFPISDEAEGSGSHGQRHFALNANDEHLYRLLLRHSVLSLTHRRGGWDCLRTYDILAAGGVPWFADLPYCGRGCLTWMPKALLFRVLEIPSLSRRLGVARPGDRDDTSRMELVFRDAVVLERRRQHVGAASAGWTADPALLLRHHQDLRPLGESLLKRLMPWSGSVRDFDDYHPVLAKRPSPDWKGYHGQTNFWHGWRFAATSALPEITWRRFSPGRRVDGGVGDLDEYAAVAAALLNFTQRYLTSTSLTCYVLAVVAGRNVTGQRGPRRLEKDDTTSSAGQPWRRSDNVCFDMERRTYPSPAEKRPPSYWPLPERILIIAGQYEYLQQSFLDGLIGRLGVASSGSWRGIHSGVQEVTVVGSAGLFDSMRSCAGDTEADIATCRSRFHFLQGLGYSYAFRHPSHDTAQSDEAAASPRIRYLDDTDATTRHVIERELFRNQYDLVVYTQTDYRSSLWRRPFFGLVAVTVPAARVVFLDGNDEVAKAEPSRPMREHCGRGWYFRRGLRRGENDASSSSSLMFQSIND